MSDLHKIISQQVYKQLVSGEIDLIDHNDLYNRLFEYYLPQMPYGVAKARTGDPYNWIFERLQQEW